MCVFMCVHTHTQFFLCSQGSQAHLRSSADFLRTVDHRYRILALKPFSKLEVKILSWQSSLKGLNVLLL